VNPYGFDALRVALPRARLTLGSPLQGREACKSVRICSGRQSQHQLASMLVRVQPDLALKPIKPRLPNTGFDD
jgi:hypothetical protein